MKFKDFPRIKNPFGYPLMIKNLKKYSEEEKQRTGMVPEKVEITDSEYRWLLFEAALQENDFTIEKIDNVFGMEIKVIIV